MALVKVPSPCLLVPLLPTVAVLLVVDETEVLFFLPLRFLSSLPAHEALIRNVGAKEVLHSRGHWSCGEVR